MPPPNLLLAQSGLSLGSINTPAQVVFDCPAIHDTYFVVIYLKYFFLTRIQYFFELINYIQQQRLIINSTPKISFSRLQYISQYMKYFPIPTYDQEKHDAILHLTQQSSSLLIQISKNLKIPLQAVHLSLWLFHCQAKILSYHNFDRFCYVCAAILVGTKASQHIRNPQDILHQMRSILKKRKNITKQDPEQLTKKWMKRIFEAEVNIMINIGFDFEINLGIHYLNSDLKEQIRDPSLIDKVKQTLTSFYSTHLVLYFDSELLGLTALDIVLKNEGISVELSGFSNQLIEKLKKDQIRQVRSFFINKCCLS